ncbi:Fc.00g042270.m01.CDS01 [Cosmosporella sp. VM-42]
MSSFSLNPQHLTAPANGDPLTLSFTSACPLSQGTSLQLSIKASDDTEIFLERMKAQEIIQSGDGSYIVSIPNHEIPRFKIPQGSDGSADIVLHAWKGEKFLGQWTFNQVQGLRFQQ